MLSLIQDFPSFYLYFINAFFQWKNSLNSNYFLHFCSELSPKHNQSCTTFAIIQDFLSEILTTAVLGDSIHLNEYFHTEVDKSGHENVMAKQTEFTGTCRRISTQDSFTTHWEVWGLKSLTPMRLTRTTSIFHLSKPLQHRLKQRN